MERDDVIFSFHNGKRDRMTDSDSIKSDDAQDALNTVEKMSAAGRKRGVPPRWYGLGIATIVTVGFALYAQQDPGNFPGLFIALGVALFTAFSRDKIGAMSRSVPETRAAIWGLIGLCVFLGIVFWWNLLSASLRSRMDTGGNRIHCWHDHILVKRKRKTSPPKK